MLEPGQWIVIIHAVKQFWQEIQSEMFFPTWIFREREVEAIAESRQLKHFFRRHGICKTHSVIADTAQKRFEGPTTNAC